MRAAVAPSRRHRGTTHISVIDRDGNAAAASLSNGEGNGSIVGNFGFMLNNMLGEEDLAPEGLGTWREGVRLSSMMAPTIILEARRQRDCARHRRLEPHPHRHPASRRQSARPWHEPGRRGEAPRLHVEKCGTVSFEPGLPEAAQAAFLALEDKAHAWPEPSMFFGGVHAARRFGDGGVEGAGDPRRRGVAIVV